nr:hypothetical protein [Lachnospiraceae bacterium]
LKDSSYPKIEIPDKDHPPGFIKNRETVICTVTDTDPRNADKPLFKRNDVKGIFNCIKGYFEDSI